MTLSRDGGNTVVRAFDFIQEKTSHRDPLSTESCDVNEPGLIVLFAGIWVPVSKFIVHFSIHKSHYLKYLSPDEYSQITDHLNMKVLPTEMSLKGSWNLDDTFVQVDEDTIPVFTNFNVRIEEVPSPDGEMKMTDLVLHDIVKAR